MLSFCIFAMFSYKIFADFPCVRAKRILRWQFCKYKLNITFIYAVRSSSVYPGLVWQGHFFRFGAILPIYTYYFHFSLWFSLRHTEQNQAMLLHDQWSMTKDAGTNFFKILKDSSNFFNTKHVIYFLNAFPCVTKVKKSWTWWRSWEF